MLSKDCVIAYGIALAACAVNLGRVIFIGTPGKQDFAFLFFGGIAQPVFPLSFYIHFDVADFIVRPGALFMGERSFLNYFLKSFLYSPFATPSFPPCSASLMGYSCCF